MLDQILAFFPPHTHPLTLVSDPDAVLADEQILAALVERGFRLINEQDPVALRYEVCQVQPFSAERPVVIITADPLNTLPYDLWQQGYHVTLALHTLFPNLAYPVLQELSPHQRWRLKDIQASKGIPAKPLSYRETLAYLLQNVFDITPDQSLRPAQLIVWLDDYHAIQDPMPSVLAEHLLKELKRVPTISSWPLEDLLASAESYRRFIQGAWDAYLQPRIGDISVAYAVPPALSFDSDRSLQDILPSLVRSGTLKPKVIAGSADLPAWTQPAVVANDEDARLREFEEGLHSLGQQLGTGELRWEQWQAIARRWAQLCLWRYNPELRLPVDQHHRFGQIQAKLDDDFYRWLRMHYTSVATQSQPMPHHLYHVPAWLAHRRSQQPDLRLALVVLDGMALADWLMIRDTWQARHPAWGMDEGLVLAQIPSVTAISRQALISGRRPNQFADTLLHNRQEERHWATFWQSQGLYGSSCVYERLLTTVGAAYPDAIDSRRTEVLCLVSSVIDDMVHGATQGTADVHASVRVWLKGDASQQQGSVWLEGLIQRLLNYGYTVTLTSDHGHTAALGIGQPQEGVLVQSRSKRARIYDNADFAHTVQKQFPDTILWHNDDLLPSSMYVLMPQGRRAFATAKKQVVTHSGLTIEELVVPLITIIMG
jgi:hypothetical protein